MAGSLLVPIAGVMVLGVMVDVDTAGPAVLVKLGVLEGVVVSSKAGLAGWIGGCRDGTRLVGGERGWGRDRTFRGNDGWVQSMGASDRRTILK